VLRHSLLALSLHHSKQPIHVPIPRPSPARLAADTPVFFGTGDLPPEVAAPLSNGKNVLKGNCAVPIKVFEIRTLSSGSSYQKIHLENVFDL
jgi:hypothetical protein